MLLLLFKLFSNAACWLLILCNDGEKYFVVSKRYATQAVDSHSASVITSHPTGLLICNFIIGINQEWLMLNGVYGKSVQQNTVNQTCMSLKLNSPHYEALTTGSCRLFSVSLSNDSSVQESQTNKQFHTCLVWVTRQWVLWLVLLCKTYVKRKEGNRETITLLILLLNPVFSSYRPTKWSNCSFAECIYSILSCSSILTLGSN